MNTCLPLRNARHSAIASLCSRWVRFAVLALCTATISQAVSLSPRGTGQVLIYPYYTVNDGQSTLLSLVNTTAHGKAIKLHFREGYNGRDVLSFNLYLSPYDVWTGVVFATSDSGGANLLTDDASCTVTSLRDNAALPTLLDGRNYVPFRNFAYVGVYQDAGSTSVTRTREGSLEVIEMGELIDAPASSGTQNVSLAADCIRLRAAWDTRAGFWTANPDTDVSKPAGGLYGSLAVVNAAQGTIFEVAATALGGFSTFAQHTAPGNAHPDLGDARSSDAGAQPLYADADVVLDTGTVHARYVGADRTVDAVSAVLMASELFGEWESDPRAGAHTEWVLASPTKRHYTDPELVAYSVSPYQERFGQSGVDASFVSLNAHWAGRIGRRESFAGPLILPPGGYVYEGALFTVTVVGDGAVHSPILKSSLDWRFLDSRHIPTGAVSISAETTISNYAIPEQLRPAQDGAIFFGQPVIGFRVVNYVNTNAAPGVIANFSAAEALRSAVHCERDHAPCQ